jgi:predicted pyridoxine 5'-phosphate oxidase superfamily flavin-nucleotide-binding protein
MTRSYLDIATTPSVAAAQEKLGSRDLNVVSAERRVFTRFGEDEAAFIAARDSFYLATASETGWPYIQHRGGPPGFLKVLDERTLGVADFSGNKQYLTLGNLAASDKASLFLMDYLHQARMKLFVRARAVTFAENRELVERLATPGYRARIERGLVFKLEAFDWNCRQHIVKRLTLPQVDSITATMQKRIAALEAENAALRASSAPSRADL